MTPPLPLPPPRLAPSPAAVTRFFPTPLSLSAALRPPARGPRWATAGAPAPRATLQPCRWPRKPSCVTARVMERRGRREEEEGEGEEEEGACSSAVSLRLPRSKGRRERGGAASLARRESLEGCGAPRAPPPPPPARPPARSAARRGAAAPPRPRRLTPPPPPPPPRAPPRPAPRPPGPPPAVPFLPAGDGPRGFYNACASATLRLTKGGAVRREEASRRPPGGRYHHVVTDHPVAECVPRPPPLLSPPSQPAITCRDDVHGRWRPPECTPPMSSPPPPTRGRGSA